MARLPEWMDVEWTDARCGTLRLSSDLTARLDRVAAALRELHDAIEDIPPDLQPMARQVADNVISASVCPEGCGGTQEGADLGLRNGWRFGERCSIVPLPDCSEVL